MNKSITGFVRIHSQVVEISLSAQPWNTQSIVSVKGEISLDYVIQNDQDVENFCASAKEKLKSAGILGSSYLMSECMKMIDLENVDSGKLIQLLQGHSEHKFSCLRRVKGGGNVATEIWARKVGIRTLKLLCTQYGCWFCEEKSLKQNQFIITKLHPHYGMAQAMSFNDILRQTKTLGKEPKPKSYVSKDQMDRCTLLCFLSERLRKAAQN